MMTMTRIDNLYAEVKAEFEGYMKRQDELADEMRDLQQKVENADGEITKHEEKGLFEKVSDVLKNRSSNEDKLRKVTEEYNEITDRLNQKKKQRTGEIMNQIQQAATAEYEEKKAGRPDEIQQEVSNKLNEIAGLVQEHDELSKEWQATISQKRNQFNKFLEKTRSAANRDTRFEFHNNFEAMGLSKAYIKAVKRG